MLVHCARAVEAVPRLQDGEKAVRRRELLVGTTGLTGAAALGLIPAASTAGIDPVAARLEALLLGEGGLARPVPMVHLGKSLAAAWRSFENCQYSELADRLPDLVNVARASRHAATGQARDQFAAVLSDTYVLVSELAVKINKNSMAWLFADRALTAARDSGNPASVAAASRAFAICMRRLGHYDGATRLLVDSALSIGADHGDPGPVLLAAYGSVLCTAAYSCAQNSKGAEALELIGEAGEAAVRMGDARVGHSVFSVANVSVYQIGVHTALGDSAQALEHARTVEQHQLPTPERHARFCVDTARAWEQFGRRDRAYQALSVAERHAPEELRRPSVRTLVANLLYSPGIPPSGLRALAARSGVLV